MKKNYAKVTAAIVTGAAILCNSFTAFATATDIQGHWAEAIIEKWMDAEKINGYPDGTFLPDNSVTRAEFAQILSNVIQDRTPAEESDHTYTDVSEEDWFYDSVMKLMQLDIAAEGETFNPEDFITRQDAMTMIGRAFYIQGIDSDAADSFADKDQIAEYALPYVTGLIENGTVGGYEDNTIRPLAEITRAESVKILDGLDLVHEKNSLKGIMDRIYEGVDAEMPMVGNTEITDENAQYYLGLENLDGIEEALASDSMVGSIPHSVCLVRVEEGGDVEAMKEKLRESVNPRKWICVGVDPEDVIVESRDNLILVVMSNFEPQKILESFMALDLSEEEPALVPDADNLMYADGYYMDYIGQMRPASVENFAAKVENLTSQYLGNSTGIYYAVVPSKSYFVNDRVQTPFDYDGMLNILSEGIKSAEYINLFDVLSLEDYYVTDPHWRQENLQQVVDRLGEAMGFETDLSQYKVNTVDEFTGQHGYNKENFPSEQLIYLTSDAIDNAVVENTEDTSFHSVYNLAKLESSSPYDMFLSGPSPLITITNENASSDKELVIFRDSSTSSLAPLLIEDYKTITLVDLRYIMSAMLGDFVDFDGKDVLFLYGEQVINNSEMLK